MVVILREATGEDIRRDMTNRGTIFWVPLLAAAMISSASLADAAEVVVAPRPVTPTFTPRARLWYPERAQRLMVTGEAVIDCDLLADGALTRCEAVSESPRGQNFTDAALALAKAKAMTAKPSEARSPSGPVERVRVTVHFDWPKYW